MDPPPATQEPGPGLNINLSSNNPFRQANATSPIPSPSLQPVQSAPVRQSQTNPFLASFEQDLKSKEESMEATVPVPVSPTKAPVGDDAKEMFKRLTISDKDKDPKAAVSRRPLPPSARGGSVSRRPRPEGEVLYRRGPNGLMIPVHPREGGGRSRNGSNDRRQRRNSESSIQDRPSTEEDRKERERRRKEREARHRERDESRDSKTSEITASKSVRSRRRMVPVDVVDQMDVTGLYGVGGMWHHDGPFDACRPHRNRKKDALAPINAFPVNSANNTIGGSGPLNAGINLEQFHGMGTEGFHDYSGTGFDQANPFPKMKAMHAHVVNPTTRVEPIHGEESLGLGTSTFLEGAPASRQAIQRTQSEQETYNENGLSRTRSLAVRLRAMSTSKRYNDDNRPRPGLASPEKGRFQDRSGGVNLSDEPVLSPGLPTTVRPSTSGNSKSENNPFDGAIAERTSYDDAYEKKGATIKTAELKQANTPAAADSISAPTSPRGVLERRSTEPNVVEVPLSPPAEPKSLGNSLLNRVKSLKGGPRRMKSERNPS